MIIKNVVLNNIRSHKSTEIKFTQGINVITGNTGSGKSSILMAIEYALFGKIGEGKEEGKILLRRGESEGDIALTLLEADSEYIIIRGLKKVNGSIRNDDSKNRVIRNGNEIDLQNRASDINEYVCRILKIQSPSPIKSFEAITYIKQDELKSLIFDTTQRKQEYIDQILQLNRYLELSDAIKPVIDEISEESRFKKSILENRKIEEDMIKTESKIIKNV
ncbi:AAA family ATPase, partial [Candidatus Parvarchaeota archaeon]|nr:AAA family ATPase [Candidatus Parvarchaeota archaeon]